MKSMSEFDEYIVHGEPRQKEKADAWLADIRLQEVDNLRLRRYQLANNHKRSQLVNQ